MPRFDDYIVYIDESGDHGLDSIDPNYPIFVLSFCLFRKDEYAQQVTSAITNLKFDYFGHDQIVLHEREIRKSMGPFRILLNREVRENFYADVAKTVREAPFIMIASAIDKIGLKEEYDMPANPYHLALAFGLERIYLHLHHLGCERGKLHLVFEKRGKKEDDELELEFRRACSSNATGNELPFEIVFSDKKSNSAGLQLADLTARPIGRKLLKPEQSNRAYEVIETKIRKDQQGSIANWGLKTFP